MDEIRESELIARAAAGDRDALSEMLQAVAPQLRSKLQADIGQQWQSVMDTDDVLQVTFVEVFLRIDRFEPRGAGSFLAWVTRIAKNNLTDAIRALRAAKQMPPERRISGDPMASSLALLEVLGVTSGTPSRHAVAEEQQQQLLAAVSELPRDYCQVLTLYDLEGRTADEVARALGRSSGAVYMLRARALDYLRDTLGAASQFEV